MLFNKSLSQRLIPDDWKAANVVPIFKKGKKTQISNYRPISLTSLVCKILERIIKNEIMTHLELNDLLDGSQHGFRSKKSTVTNLLEFSHQLTELLDQDQAIDVLYLDFQKAFDKIPHKRLILKLKECFIDGPVVEWIEEWLTDRKQRVVQRGESSEWSQVSSGVPQRISSGADTFFYIYKRHTK